MSLARKTLVAACGVLVIAAALPATAIATSVPEPSGYWTGEDHGAVPATVAGGTVIQTAAALEALIRKGKTVVVDVSPSPRRPAGMAPDMPWMPKPHPVIPGAVWLAGAGTGTIAPALDHWYQTRLAALTGNDKDRPLVVYCHRDCWLSWNGAKRAIAYGYRHVYWYPDGIEGWQAAGLPTTIATAEEPSS